MIYYIFVLRPQSRLLISKWQNVVPRPLIKELSHSHDLSGRSPHVVPVSTIVSKRDKDGVSSLETHLHNV